MDVYTALSMSEMFGNKRKIYRYCEKQNLLFINQDNFSGRKTSQDSTNKK